MFDFLRGIAVLLAFFFVGTWLHRWGVPIPGGVLGLLLFYFALASGIIKLRWVESAANFLLHHMVLLFVPLTVGLIDLGPLLSRQAVAILASLIISFVAVLLTAGLLARKLLANVPGDEQTAAEPLP